VSLGDDAGSLPEIDVLLATYNGAKYLDEFLNSVENQVGVRINLLVSDDGSVDDSLEIVRRHSKNFYSLVTMDGPKQGPTANFFHLMSKSKAPFVAFADQDDIWEPEHLQNSIRRLRPYEKFPALTFSSTLTFFDDGRDSFVWPLLKDMPTVRELFMEGKARGCSMVFNRTANELLNSYQPAHAHCHDTWAFLVLRTCGVVLYERSPEIRYRIHANNTIGLGNRSFFRTARTIQNRTWGPYLQLDEVLHAYGDRMEDIQRGDVASLLNDLRGNFFHRLRRLVLTRARFRETWYNEFRSRVAFFLLPWLFDVGKRKN
jgi:glycosyltransferase involved in cell wall biosynthesis